MQVRSSFFMFMILMIVSASAMAQRAAEVVSGPMLGHTELRTSTVWIECKEAVNEVVMQYWEKTKSRAQAKKIAKKKSEVSFPNIFTFQLTQLEPATTYAYQLTIGKENKVIGAGEVTTRPLWQWRTDPPDFSFLTGSCAYFNEPVYDRPGRPYGNDSSIFLSMAKETDAAFMLWLGDNWYTREVDYFSEWGLNYRPSRDRSHVALQPLLKAMPHYAIWDDHDYGPDNSDKSFVLKEASRKTFMNYWLNPSFGQNGQGIYSKVTVNDVDVFLLDARWFRSNDATPNTAGSIEQKRMFGRQQMEWLKTALRQSNDNSKINFRVIATGSQVLNLLSPIDCLVHYPIEFNELMTFLEAEKINGVLFLTGDRHHSSIIRRERKDAYPLYDITASSLTAGATKIRGAELNNPNRVLELEDQNSYCKISIEGKGQDRLFKVQFLNKEGMAVRDWQVALSDLTFKK